MGFLTVKSGLVFFFFSFGSVGDQGPKYLKKTTQELGPSNPIWAHYLQMNATFKDMKFHVSLCPSLSNNGRQTFMCISGRQKCTTKLICHVIESSINKQIYMNL